MKSPTGTEYPYRLAETVNIHPKADAAPSSQPIAHAAKLIGGSVFPVVERKQVDGKEYLRLAGSGGWVVTTHPSTGAVIASPSNFHYQIAQGVSILPKSAPDEKASAMHGGKRYVTGEVITVVERKKVQGQLFLKLAQGGWVFQFHPVKRTEVCMLLDGTAEWRKIRRMITENENVLAIWQPDPQNIENNSARAFSMFAVPCLWPHAIIMCPCLTAAYITAQQTMRATSYILTNKNMYQMVDADIGGGCIKTGLDGGSEELSSVTSVAIDNKGGGACDLCPISGVVLGMPVGSVLANTGGRQSKRSSLPNDKVSPLVRHRRVQSIQHLNLCDLQFFMFTDQPEHVRNVITIVRDQIRQANAQGQAGLIGQEFRATAPLIGQAVGQEIRSAIAVGNPMLPPIADVVARDEPEDDSLEAMEKILKLKQLLDAGAITEEEFNEKKAPLMAAV
jgi:hypothetical protein